MTVGDPTSQGLGQSSVPVPEVTGKKPAYLEASGVETPALTPLTSPTAMESPASPAAMQLTLNTAFNYRESLESSENHCTTEQPCQALRYLEV